MKSLNLTVNLRSNRQLLNVTSTANSKMISTNRYRTGNRNNVTLAKDGAILFSEENKIAKEHASWLHLAIGRILDKAK